VTVVVRVSALARIFEQVNNTLLRGEIVVFNHLPNFRDCLQ